MISKLDYRIWIIFFWCLILKCFLNDFLVIVNAQTLAKATDDTTDAFRIDRHRNDDDHQRQAQKTRISEQHNLQASGDNSNKNYLKLVSYAANTYNLNSYVDKFSDIEDDTTTPSYDKHDFIIDTNRKVSKRINTKTTATKKTKTTKQSLDRPSDSHLPSKRTSYEKLIKSQPKYRKIRRKERAATAVLEEDILLPPLAHTRTRDTIANDDGDEYEPPKDGKAAKSFAIAKSSTIKTALPLDGGKRNGIEQFSKSLEIAEELNGKTSTTDNNNNKGRNNKNSNESNDDDDDDDRKISSNFAGRNNNKTNLVVKQQHHQHLVEHHEHGLQTNHYSDKRNNQINERINSPATTTTTAATVRRTTTTTTTTRIPAAKTTSTITGTTNQDNKAMNNVRNGTTVEESGLGLDSEDSIIIGDQQLIIITSNVAASKVGVDVPSRKRKARHKDEDDDDDDDDDGRVEEPLALPLRPLSRGPYEEEQKGDYVVVYAEQHSPTRLNCEVDLDINSSIWMKDGQIVSTVEKTSRVSDFRFIREARGGLTINNVMLEDDGIWQCEAENFRGYVENARPIKLVVLDPPKTPYLLIDSRRLDAGNIFVPVKENSELSLACISEGGNPKPVLTWEMLMSPGIDRHVQKVANDIQELQEVKREKPEKESYQINTGAISEAKLPNVYRAHHNARILCVMEHPTLKMRQNASILLDVQYTPSFAITRTPGFGYPLREGIEVSLKCDVDSNPPSTPLWQKDDTDTPVPQTGDGFLNFTSISREHTGWYKCTSRHLNYQYSSIGYYLSVRYDSVDVTSEPVEQEISVSPHNTNINHKGGGQMEVELGGAVTLQCPQGSLGCWSHLDPMTARLKGLGVGLYSPNGQFSLKDVVYQDAGTYKCIGQNVVNRKKLEILQTVNIAIKGVPTVSARNSTPVAFPGSPLHLSVEFCANPPAYAARWLHGDRVYTPGNQYGIDVLAYGFIDLPTPFCKEARLTYVHMHERVPRTFYFIVSSPTGVAEAIFNVNFTLKHNKKSNSMPNSIDEDEELMEPEEIHFPIFGSSSTCNFKNYYRYNYYSIVLLMTCFYICFY